MRAAVEVLAPSESQRTGGEGERGERRVVCLSCSYPCSPLSLTLCSFWTCLYAVLCLCCCMVSCHSCAIYVPLCPLTPHHSSLVPPAGEVVAGVEYGTVRCQEAGGARYEGEVKAGRMHGQGRYTYPNGEDGEAAVRGRGGG